MAPAVLLHVPDITAQFAALRTPALFAGPVTMTSRRNSHTQSDPRMPSSTWILHPQPLTLTERENENEPNSPEAYAGQKLDDPLPIGGGCGALIGAKIEAAKQYRKDQCH
ncbi:hypothetical protein N7474_003855 [Penicillium riverlandense]|uniref:uncharacterized protein n=1 Tax=Penicillium riverlandense TaxID=1903569 RepID=UPI002549AD03|nr:uncharacterized protein N7474_003855 [Penicillium riverlandense]KAJ5818264.1 hypothetical protein N7474_003855 [Penicillium riverlandense]